MKKDQKYIDLKSDFAFKKIHRNIRNKKSTINLLENTIPSLKGKIEDITFVETEQLGQVKDNKIVIFDLICKTSNNETIIVEMQTSKQKYFIKRSLFYGFNQVVKQGEKGDWDYNFDKVYVVCLLDFIPPEFEKYSNQYQFIADLKIDVTNQVLTDVIIFHYYCLPFFNQSFDELDNELQKWLYLLKNINSLTKDQEEIISQQAPFSLILQQAEILNYTEEEMIEYTDEMDKANSRYAELQTAIEEGREEGKIQYLKQIISKMRDKKWSNQEIVDFLEIDLETLNRMSCE